MTVRTISREAYADHIASGQALRQSDRVFAAIKARPQSTRAELARDTGIEKTSICGRVKELLQAGRIEEVEGIKCSVKGNVVHGLVPAREFHGGSSEGYSPAQVRLWEVEQDGLIRPTKAREIAAQTDGQIRAYLEWWRTTYGEASYRKFRAKVEAEWRRLNGKEKAA